MASKLKGAAPLDMLRKCRAHFAYVAKRARLKQGRARSVDDMSAAGDVATINETFVGEIDATLRDWA